MSSSRPAIKIQFARGNRVISCFMLMLFAIPSLGLTAAASRSLLDSQRQVEVEEIQERVACSTQRRMQFSPQFTNPPCCFGAAGVKFNALLVVAQAVATSGHRIASGFLAPMRC